MRDCQRDRDGTPKQSEIHHQHYPGRRRYFYIWTRDTHTKSDGDADDGEGIHNKKKSVSADCFSPEERKKKEEEDES